MLLKMHKLDLRSTSLSSSDSCPDETSRPLTFGVTKCFAFFPVVKQWSAVSNALVRSYCSTLVSSYCSISVHSYPLGISIRYISCRIPAGRAP